MSITKILLSYFFTTVFFFAVDMLWLGLIAKNFYKKYLGNFLNPNVNWTAAIIFYLLFIVGILIFAVYPAIEKNSLIQAVIMGALFGFFTYATYDLTNLATLKDWPILVTIVDMIWGSVLTALVSTAGYFIVKFLN